MKLTRIFVFILANIEATVILRAEQIKKGDNIYYNVKDFYVNFDIGDAKIHLDDLFNGDKDLGMYGKLI